ncbi:integrase, catalytic region, zinc finger, CCHC-type containing protein [Tanacetum coccineum]
MTGNRSKLKNFVEKFIGSVRFGNDHFGAIMGYGDYVIGDSVISRVYYVEGLGHNLFSVGQFCDSDLEVAFRKHSCFVRDINGADLLKGSRRTNLYTISIDDMMKSSPICLLSKASKSKSWLWHRRLNHLNFGTINDLSKRSGVGIFHQMSVPRTPHYTAVVKKDGYRTLRGKCTYKADILKSTMFLWEKLSGDFIPTMFDEYFDQSIDSEPVPTATVVNAPIVSTNTSVSTTIAQDAPSTSHSLSSSQVHPPVFPQGVAAGPTIEDT